MIGGKGNDLLVGGRGSDRFIFADLSDGTDIIADFEVGQDWIQVSAKGFGGGLVASVDLDPQQFVLGTIATQSTSQFLYDQSSGSLFFDQDGTGGLAATRIAVLDSRPVLSDSKFYDNCITIM